MFYLCLRIDPIIVVFSNCKNQANLMDITDCRLQIADWGCEMWNVRLRISNFGLRPTPFAHWILPTGNWLLSLYPTLHALCYFCNGQLTLQFCLQPQAQRSSNLQHLLCQLGIALC